MSVKELKDILDNCKQDAEVYIMCSIGPGLPVKFKPFDIYECKADGSIRFDFIDYIYENELEEKLYSYNGGTSGLYCTI